MPFYEYECQSCKYYTEIMQKISDAPLKKCPSCGQRALKKLVSAPVFRLKGAGWYETDFKSERESKRNLAVEKEAEAKEAKPSEATASEASKSDVKSPEPKPAAAPARSEGARKSVAITRKATARRKPKVKARAGRKARR